MRLFVHEPQAKPKSNTRVFPYFNCLSSVVCITRQREYQLHRENKYLKIECLLKSQARYRVWLFFISTILFFRCGFNLFVDILNGNRIYTLRKDPDDRCHGLLFYSGKSSIRVCVSYTKVIQQPMIVELYI